MVTPGQLPKLAGSLKSLMLKAGCEGNAQTFPQVSL